MLMKIARITTVAEKLGALTWECVAQLKKGKLQE